MALEDLEQELKKIDQLLPKIEPFWQRHLSDLAKETLAELDNIKVIPAHTSGGLESVSSVINNLYMAKVNIKQELENPEGLSDNPQIPKIEANPVFSKTTPLPTSVIKKPLPTQIPSPATPPTKPPLAMQKQNNLPQKLSISETSIQIKPQAPLPQKAPSKQQPITTTTKSNFDFGPYYKQNP